MQCGCCGRVVRWDESLSLTPVLAEVMPEVYEQQQLHACPDCVARAAGREPPEPRRYPRGQPVPRHPERNCDLPVCGLCRVALPWGQDRGEPMRLRADVLDADDLAAGILPGDCYVSCAACVAKYQGRILRELQAAGLAPETMRPTQVRRGWLL